MFDIGLNIYQFNSPAIHANEKAGFKKHMTSKRLHIEAMDIKLSVLYALMELRILTNGSNYPYFPSIISSMSAISIGIAAVKFLFPVSVIRISFSKRHPIPSSGI